MNFRMYVSYDEGRDDFYAMITDGADHAEPVFEISDTQEMVEYIETGIMAHIDDTDGLKKFLIHQGILTDNDEIMIVERALP